MQPLLRVELLDKAILPPLALTRAILLLKTNLSTYTSLLIHKIRLIAPLLALERFWSVLQRYDLILNFTPFITHRVKFFGSWVIQHIFNKSNTIVLTSLLFIGTCNLQYCAFRQL